jgi:hypothetical protein
MKKYIGWDIGIINLSYCIIDENYNILDWNIINLIDDEQEKNKCYEKMRNGNTCEKKINFVDWNNQRYYCKVHSKKKSNLKEIGKCYEEGCSTNAKVILEGGKQVCKKHSKNEVIIKTLRNKKASKEDLDVLGKMMIKKIDQNIDLNDVSEIVIENQPVLKNPKMKSIQMILFTYFLIKKPEIKLKFVSANSKLNFKIENETIKKIKEIKNKYQQRKKLGIEYCKHFICDNEKWEDFFTNFKKKDDLADAYLLIRKYLSEK